MLSGGSNKRVKRTTSEKVGISQRKKITKTVFYFKSKEKVYWNKLKELREKTNKAAKQMDIQGPKL